MRDIVEAFLTYYMTERNIDAAVALLTDDVISLGTGEQEIGIGKAATEALYLEEAKQSPNPIYFRFLDYHEQVLSPDAQMCFAKALIQTHTTEGAKLEVEGRLTSSACRQAGVWKLSSFHMSMAAASEEREEFLPLQSLYGKAEAQTQKSAIDLMKDMLPGGIIGGYMEPGFPLYIINEEMLRLMHFEDYDDMMRFSDGMVINLIHPEDRNKVNSQVTETLKHANEYDVTYRQLRKDGSFFWVHDKGRRITAEDGREAIVSVLVDVSDIESAASAAEEHLNAIMQMNPTAMSTFRINLTQNTLTHAVSRYPNLQRLEEKGTLSGYVEDALAFIPYQAEREEFAQTFANQSLVEEYQNGRVQVSMKHHYIPDDTTNCILQTIVSMIKNAVTQEIEGVVYTLDITQETYNEKINSLLVNDSKLDIVVLNIKKGTFFIPRISPKWHYTAAMAEQNYHTFLTQIIEHFVVKEEKEHCRECARLDVIASQLEKSGRYGFNTIWEKNGKRRNIRFTCHFFDDMHEQIIGLYEDVTDVVQKDNEYEQKLKTALAAAEKANRAKTDFLSRMSHDIRTPLNGVIGMTEIALKENKDARLQPDLETIESSGKFLLSLINDILDVSRIESGKMDLHPEPYSVSAFGKMIDAIVVPMMQEKNITFACEMKCGLKCAMLDKVRFNQIFFNLLSNAAKYTPENGHVLFSAIALSADEKTEWVRFSVKDNGIGMSPAFMDKAFEPFEQMQDHGFGTDSRQGAGLGLAIVKELVTLMGGKISVRSEPGKGSEFLVDLPLFKCALPEDDDASPDAPSVESLAGKHILLVEDNEINRLVAVRLLEAKHMRVSCAVNGKIAVEAFAQASEGSIDAVLMDVRMPVMDGLEATRQIRAIPRPDAKRVPIIAMSANAYEEDRQLSLAAGMNEHLSKPVEPEKLYATIRRYLRG